MFDNLLHNSTEVFSVWVKALSNDFSTEIERFSYDLEMKAREQNRNDKRTEIERFDWFIERTDKRAWLFIG